jgi:hypothetical protein
MILISLLIGAIASIVFIAWVVVVCVITELNKTNPYE